MHKKLNDLSEKSLFRKSEEKKKIALVKIKERKEIEAIMKIKRQKEIDEDNIVNKKFFATEMDLI